MHTCDAYALAGVHPGTLHAHGRLVESHDVSFSIGLVGEYLLHVRLRGRAAALPGSPFKLTVLPNMAHAPSCSLSGGLITGKVSQSVSQ